MIITCPECSGPFQVPDDKIAPLVQVECPSCSFRMILDFEAANNPALVEDGMGMASGYRTASDYRQAVGAEPAVAAPARPRPEPVPQRPAAPPTPAARPRPVPTPVPAPIEPARAEPAPPPEPAPAPEPTPRPEPPPSPPPAEPRPAPTPEPEPEPKVERPPPHTPPARAAASAAPPETPSPAEPAPADLSQEFPATREGHEADEDAEPQPGRTGTMALVFLLVLAGALVAGSAAVFETPDPRPLLEDLYRQYLR